MPLRGAAALAADAGAARRHVTASLLSLGGCLAVFLGFGAAMWSQINLAAKARPQDQAAHHGNPPPPPHHAVRTGAADQCQPPPF
jgi:hypothetical protein